ncbi:MAG: tRNA lysidine(34) synthetase TilS [Eubacterium sp.]|nr:tRNA lysidine(34) synthetase TilS [Eubacterium sp.]
MKEKFLDLVKSYIEKNKMFYPEDGLIIGVSGGADSVALLRAMLMVKDASKIRVVHINHGIRGEEAYRDQHFVENLCKEYGLQCRVYSGDIPQMARKMHMTEEEAGRRFRYECFKKEADLMNQELMDQVMSSDIGDPICPPGRGLIAVAHNKDDLAETVLFNMVRGSSLMGLTGISQVRDIIVRPLLMTSRKEIEEFLKELGQDYVTDSTNLSTDYTRNKLRHIIIPELMKINEGAVNHIVDIACEAEELRDYVRQERENYLDQVNASQNKDDRINHGNSVEAFRDEGEGIFMEDEVSEVYIDIPLLRGRSPLVKGEIVLYHLEMICHKRKDISRKHINSVLDLCDMETGKQVSLPYGMVAVRTYDKIRIYDSAAKNEEGDLNGAFEIKYLSRDEVIEIRKDQYTKMIDCDKICDKLSFRHPKDGDFIVTREDGGRKKLSRFFTDNKVERDKRKDMILVADGNEIVWVVGLRLSERYKLTDKTEKVMQITFKSK